ncbi:hypothetical protein QCA50_009743 [Cerrena zonata]|uniref:Uncharacterized protein n=1 Tax=Cerrena zonata TaxID=2478898 RepID=A0AAW0G1N6_9APHY
MMISHILQPKMNYRPERAAGSSSSGKWNLGVTVVTSTRDTERTNGVGLNEPLTTSVDAEQPSVQPDHSQSPKSERYENSSTQCARLREAYVPVLPFWSSVWCVHDYIIMFLIGLMLGTDKSFSIFAVFFSLIRLFTIIRITFEDRHRPHLHGPV